MTQTKIKDAKRLHWGATSQDYSRYRPGYPKHFFILLRQLGIGLARQEILDLGSGTGALAIPFARQGARVTAVDLSEGQIQAGKQVAHKQGVKIRFKVASAEETKLPNHAFDVITASMCWRYFDAKRMEMEVPRLLRPEGFLLICGLTWIRDGNAVASQTNELLATFNAGASRSDHGGNATPVPDWSRNWLRLRTYHQFKIDLPFIRVSWRGRIRASKWIGASLSKEKTDAFDREHQALLERIAPVKFVIPHQVRIQIFELKNVGER